MTSMIAVWLAHTFAIEPALGTQPAMSFAEDALVAATEQSALEVDYTATSPGIFDATAAEGTAGGQSSLDAVNASVPNSSPGTETKGDPWEPANRLSFRFSDMLDGILVRPAAVAYNSVVPELIRRGLRRVALNLGEPRTAANDLLQGRLGAAGSSGLRFLTNSTLGVLGVFDVADGMGLKRHDNDFGLTMARLSVGAGPYLYVPVLGPTSLRDLGGEVVDFVFDPFTWTRNTQVIDVGLRATEALDHRIGIDADLESLRKTSADLYATIRSVHLQQREGEVKEGRIDLQDLPDFPDSRPAEPPSPAPPPASASPVSSPSLGAPAQ